MARRAVPIEQKIADAQERVVRAKARYDREVAAPGDLLAKRDAMRKDELWEAVAASGRTYEEIMAFIGGPKDPGSET